MEANGNSMEVFGRRKQLIWNQTHTDPWEIRATNYDRKIANLDISVARMRGYLVKEVMRTGSPAPPPSWSPPALPGSFPPAPPCIRYHSALQQLCLVSWLVSWLHFRLQFSGPFTLWSTVEVGNQYHRWYVWYCTVHNAVICGGSNLHTF